MPTSGLHVTRIHSAWSFVQGSSVSRGIWGVHTCACMISDVIFFLAAWYPITVPWLDHPLFIHSPLGRHFGRELIYPTDLISIFVIFRQGLAFVRALCRGVWLPRSLGNCKHPRDSNCFRSEAYIFIPPCLLLQQRLGEAGRREKEANKL